MSRHGCCSQDVNIMHGGVCAEVNKLTEPSRLTRSVMIQLQCASCTFNTVTTRHVFSCSVKDAVQIGIGTINVCVLFEAVAPVT